MNPLASTPILWPHLKIFIFVHNIKKQLVILQMANKQNNFFFFILSYSLYLINLSFVQFHLLNLFLVNLLLNTKPLRGRIARHFDFA